MEKKLPQELEFYESYILFHWIALLLLCVAVAIGAVMYFSQVLSVDKIIKICGAGFIIFSLIPLLSPEVRLVTPEKKASFVLTKEGIQCFDEKRSNVPNMGLIPWRKILNEKLQAEKPYRGMLRLKFQVQTDQEKPANINFDIALIAQHEGKPISEWANEYLQASRQSN
jgi:hypothetical protein